MESLCLVVPKKNAEPIRTKLLERGILRKDLKIRGDSKNVYLPVTQRVDLGYPVEKAEFEEVQPQVKDYRVLVDIPNGLRPLLPSSYDTLGAIALVKMADEVLPYAPRIGEAILATQKSIRTVCADHGVEDKFRTRKVEVVAGEATTTTLHKEYGMLFKMDVARAFFSPRLATEREIVTRQVRPGEVVVDMFAGIGPFSIMIAKTRTPKVVYAIDINPDAIAYLKENIALNKVETVRPILGDAREELAKLEAPDRVIMNLPHSAFEFVSDAVKALRPGGAIHYYEVMEEARIPARLEEISVVAAKNGRVLKELARRKVKSYSPTMNVYAFDLAFL